MGSCHSPGSTRKGGPKHIFGTVTPQIVHISMRGFLKYSKVSTVFAVMNPVSEIALVTAPTFRFEIDKSFSAFSSTDVGIGSGNVASLYNIVNNGGGIANVT